MTASPATAGKIKAPDRFCNSGTLHIRVHDAFEDHLCIARSLGAYGIKGLIPRYDGTGSIMYRSLSLSTITEKVKESRELQESRVSYYNQGNVRSQRGARVFRSLQD